MIELKNVSKYYSNDGIVTLGLRNINLSLGKNEIVAITGDSGSGKSTLLNVICGMDTYDEGEMFFCGNETSHFNQNDMDYYRKKHIGENIMFCKNCGAEIDDNAVVMSQMRSGG